LTLATGNTAGVKGGYLWSILGKSAPESFFFPSEMAQNFYLASFAFIICLSLTFIISLATARTKSDEQLKGLVYSLTPKLKDEEKSWFLRPAPLGVALLVVCVILNVVFR
jgi:SSS family solute:Na+ symporter